MTLDFIARRPYYLDHLAPIWNGMTKDERGTFYYMGKDTQAYAEYKLKNPVLAEYTEVGNDPGASGHNPILAAAYGDAIRAADFDPRRPVILIEHGVGLTFGKAGYANGLGQRAKIAIMPVQSKFIQDRVHPDLRGIPHPIVGVPKLDKWAGELAKPHPMPKSPVIAIAFHHGDKNSRPGVIGSAWEHYSGILPELANKYKLILHAHPTAGEGLRERYANIRMDFPKVEYVEDFEEVMKRADILINDASSAAYEFLVTGKPVILLNAPWFDRSQNFGLRFWEYTDIGLIVDDPDVLIPAIEATIEDAGGRNAYKYKRERAVKDLFPFLGESTHKMISEIQTFLSRWDSTHKPANIGPKLVVNKPVIPFKGVRKSEERGVLYMCFGDAARVELIRSVASLRNVGSDLPIAVVGDKADMPEHLKEFEHTFIQWIGKDPYDATKA